MENNTIFLISVFLVMLIGLEHIVICGLEIFASPEKQANMFDMPLEYVKKQETRISMANQGIYNGMLGITILLSYFVFSNNPAVLIHVWQLLMLFIIVVGAFGGFTATKKIFFVQMLPALIVLILLFL